MAEITVPDDFLSECEIKKPPEYRQEIFIRKRYDGNNPIKEIVKIEISEKDYSANYECVMGFLHRHYQMEISKGIDEDHCIVDKKDYLLVTKFLRENPQFIKLMLREE